MGHPVVKSTFISTELEQTDKMFNPNKVEQFKEDIKKTKDDMRYDQ